MSQGNNIKPITQASIEQLHTQSVPLHNDDDDQEQISVLYIWFGNSVPEDYLIKLSQLDYPVIFLKNPSIKRKFNRPLLDIEKSDYFRLEYLYQNGGIYSDFDNTIDYRCLLRILKPFRNTESLVFMTDNKHTRDKTKEITTNLIYAPNKKNKILQKIIDKVDESNGNIWDFAGTKFMGQFNEPIQLNMSQCVQHSYDWSWYKDSNEALNKENNAHLKFQKKLIKKAQILKKKNQMELQVKGQEKHINELKAQVINLLSEKAALKAENQLKNHQQSQKDRTSVENPKLQQLIIQEMLMTNQTLLKKLQFLEMENTNLQFENTIKTYQIYGIWLIVFVVGFFIFSRLRKRDIL